MLKCEEIFVEVRGEGVGSWVRSRRGIEPEAGRKCNSIELRPSLRDVDRR